MGSEGQPRLGLCAPCTCDHAEATAVQRPEVDMQPVNALVPAAFACIICAVRRRQKAFVASAVTTCTRVGRSKCKVMLQPEVIGRAAWQAWERSWQQASPLNPF